MPELLSRPGATILLACLLTAGTPACAEEQHPFPGGEWQTVTAYMSPENYRKACRRNQRLLRKMAKSYAKDSLRSVGVPETGIRLMGAMAGLAVGGDAHLKLNKSRHTRLALEFKDVIGSERSVSLGFRLKW